MTYPARLAGRAGRGSGGLASPRLVEQRRQLRKEAAHIVDVLVHDARGVSETRIARRSPVTRPWARRMRPSSSNRSSCLVMPPLVSPARAWSCFGRSGPSTASSHSRSTGALPVSSTSPTTLAMDASIWRPNAPISTRTRCPRRTSLAATDPDADACCGVVAVIDLPAGRWDRPRAAGSGATCATTLLSTTDTARQGRRVGPRGPRRYVVAGTSHLELTRA
jgi:hypothetical protein